MRPTLTLEEQVAQRKLEAKEKRICEKATLIANALGSPHKWEVDPEVNILSVSSYFKRDPFIVKVRSELPGRDYDNEEYNTVDRVSVQYKDGLYYEQVFLGGTPWGEPDDIYCFTPGPWERKFDRLWAEAAKAGPLGIYEITGLAETRKQSREKDLRKRFGL